MAAIDDGFADARASQISLMNKFTVVYEDSAIKNTPDFEINIPSVWKVAKNGRLLEVIRQNNQILAS